MYCYVMQHKRSCCSDAVVKSDPHATCLHSINDRIIIRPESITIIVTIARWAAVIPVAAAEHPSTVSTPTVVVVVRSAKHSSIGVQVCRCPCHGIARVSAVSVHRQTVVTSLISDWETRVFSPVPYTVSSLDLHTDTRYVRPTYPGLFRILVLGPSSR